MAESGRLDAELVRRGIARSRGAATEAIADGRVRVDGATVLKASTRVGPGHDLAIDGDDGYVSRSAGKLAAALDAFGIPVAGRLALDVGASTGGFTQVLLERGAREVIALDVGHGQLATVIRADARVRVVEGENARELTAGRLAEVAGTREVPDLVVVDVSFIPLALVLPALVATVGASADLVLLIKPQFEVGRPGIREGVVTDVAKRRDAVRDVLWTAFDLGLGVGGGVLSSPVVGGAGNQEYLAHLSGWAVSDPTEWERAVAALD